MFLSYSDSLAHCDLVAELVLQCDASSVGIGATLLQPGPDSTLEPVAYTSRVLNSTEQNYSQIEPESLAIVFGVTKFCQYLLGRHFKLLIDHKPLITLLGERFKLLTDRKPLITLLEEHKPVSQLASQPESRCDHCF